MTMRQMKWLDRVAGSLLAGVVALYEALAMRARSAFGPPPKRGGEIRKILITKYLGMGSIILATPMIDAVRMRYPRAKVLFLTFEANGEICRLLSVADETLTIRTSGVIVFVRDLFVVIRRLRREKIDLAFDLEFLANFSALMLYASGASERIGYSLKRLWRNRLLSRRVEYDPCRHITRVFCDLVEPDSGRGTGPLPIATPQVSGESVRFVEELLRWKGVARERAIVCVNVTAGDLCLERRWPAIRFAMLIEKILRRDLATVVLIGAPADRSYVESVIRLVGPSPDLVNVAGELTVEQLLALLTRSRLFITNDGGALHLACSTGTPVVALFGPESPLLYGPAGDGQIVFYKGVSCSPCLTVTNNKTPPCRGKNICMDAISVEEVFAAVDRFFDGERSAATSQAGKRKQQEAPQAISQRG